MNLKKTKHILYFFIFISEVLFSDITFYQEENKTITTLYKIESTIKEPIDVLRWYKNSKGTQLGLKNKFFLKISDSLERDKILHDFNLTVLKQYSKNLYLVKSNQHTSELLRTINEININLGKLVAHPNFYKKVRTR